MPLPPRVSDLTGFDLLLSVARLGSLGRAAAEHGISQPAASARIRHLEGRLGLALIDRSPRGSTLTPAGALVADWAQAVADAAAALDAGVTALRRERESRLRVAASMTVAEYLLPAWLTALRAAGSGAAVALSAVNSAEVVEAVLTGAADIGFVEAPGVPDGLRAGPVGRDMLTVVVAPSHPWARRRSGVPPAELAATALVSRESGSGTRASSSRRCAHRPAWNTCRRWPSCPPPPRSRPRSRPAPVPPCSAPWPSRPSFRPGHCAR